MDFNENNNQQSYTPAKGKFKRIGRIGLIIVILVLIVVLALTSISVVPEGHIGVKYRLGSIVSSNLEAGPHFCLPMIESIRRVDVREQVYEMDTTAYTKDTQTVERLQIKVNYLYDQSSLTQLIRTIGIENIESKLIIPQLNSILKNAVGKYKAEELVQNRSALQEQVEAELRTSLSEYGIIVSALNLENIDFEDSFEESIRAKVAAEQEALRVKNETAAKEEEARQLVIAAEAEAESKKIQAEADAYAIEVIQKQLQASPEYIQLQMVEKWNGEWPQVMGNTVNPFVTLDGTASIGN